MTGRFTPVIPRDLRLEVPERIDARGRILTPLDEAATRAAITHLLRRRAASPSSSTSSTPTPTPPTSSAPPRSPPSSGPTPTSPPATRSSPSPASTSAASPPPSTPPSSRSSSATSPACQSELAARGYPPRPPRRDRQRRHGLRPRRRPRGRQDGDVRPRLRRHGRRSPPPAAPASPNLITYDMGGTSTDVALIRDGAPPVSTEIELEYAMPIHVPMVDVRTVGAGGGSIARLNAAGLLEVGPDSAGADPGPIASGRGGTRAHHHRRQPPPRPPRPRPLPRHRRRPPHPRRHHRPPPRPRPRRPPPRPSSASPTPRWPNAIRMVSLSLGADPRDFTLFAFGGAGPLHAAALARELGIPRVLVPARPGITNALGCVVADLRHDFVRTLEPPARRPRHRRGPRHPRRPGGRRAARLIAAEPVTPTAITATHAADMQFVGQTHLLRVPLPSPPPRRDRPPRPLRGRLPRPLPRRAPRDPPRPRQPHHLRHRPPPRRSTSRLLLDPAARRPTLAEAQTATRPVCFAALARHPRLPPRPPPARRHPHRPRHPRADGHHHRPPPRRPPRPGRRRQPPDHPLTAGLHHLLGPNTPAGGAARNGRPTPPSLTISSTFAATCPGSVILPLTNCCDPAAACSRVVTE